MKILLDLAPVPSDFVPQSPSEIAGDMTLRALPVILVAAVIVVAAAFIVSKISKK